MLGIGEAVAGYQLLKAGISACKSALDTGKDASSIAKAVGAIFNAQDQIQKEKNHNMTVKDQLGMENILNEQIDKAELDRQLDEIRLMCNMKYGATFWADCLKLRNDRIQEQKEKEKKAKIRKAQEAKEIRKSLFTLFSIIVVAGLIFMAFALYQRAFAKEYTRSQKIHRGDIVVIKTTTCRLFAQDIKENGTTRWCFYQTRIGFDRKFATITQDSVAFCQREFQCRVNALTDKPPKEVNETMKNLNKGFK